MRLQYYVISYSSSREIEFTLLCNLYLSVIFIDPVSLQYYVICISSVILIIEKL